MVYHQLNRKLDVYRRAGAADAMGGENSRPVKVGTVRAKLPQPSPREVERVRAEQAGAEQRRLLLLAPKADVRRGDELRGDGETFRVLQVLDPSTESYRHADCELIQAEERGP